MLNNEQTQILEQVIFLLFKLRNDQSVDNWEEKRAREFNKLAAELRQQDDENEDSQPSLINDETGFLKFTPKEILKMPQRFRKHFRAEGCTVFYRIRKRGKRSFSYEARYRRHGYDISRSAPTLELLKERFIEALKEIEAAPQEGQQTQTTNAMPGVPETFTEFAEYYFEKFYKRKVSHDTFKKNMNRYDNHIKPYFGSILIKDVTPLSCQELIDKLIAQGLRKTPSEVKGMLNGIFEMAIKHGIINFNPIGLIFYKGYAQEHGARLTSEEESALFSATVGTPYFLMFAVALYTGLRPNEYKSARIEGRFIVSINSKQKDGKIHFKKIPITPMLAPYLEGVTELQFYGANRMGERLRAILPGHKLYDLRTTFYSRCQECGVSEVALKKFMGHSLGKLADAYSELSDDYLYNEGLKFRY